MARLWIRVKHPENLSKCVVIEVEIEPNMAHTVRWARFEETSARLVAKKKPEDACGADDFRAKLLEHGYEPEEVGMLIEEEIDELNTRSEI